MLRLELSKANCCIRVFKHKSPDECTQETESQRTARLDAMQRNIHQFLKLAEREARHE